MYSHEQSDWSNEKIYDRRIPLIKSGMSLYACDLYHSKG